MYWLLQLLLTDAKDICDNDLSKQHHPMQPKQHETMMTHHVSRSTSELNLHIV